jgi:nitrogen fixation NifU-like protein
MAALRNLYQEIILDHNRQPRNFRRLEDASHHAHGHNPLCGDQVDVYLHVHDGRVTEIAFEGDSCAISMASASIMTELLQGRSLGEVHELSDRFRQLLAGNAARSSADSDDLEVLAGVRMFPARVKCATLPWHTLLAALQERTSASTE